METPSRYYLRGSNRTRTLQRVLVIDPTAAHASATFYELTYRERVALSIENGRKS